MMQRDEGEGGVKYSGIESDANGRRITIDELINVQGWKSAET